MGCSRDVVNSTELPRKFLEWGGNGEGCSWTAEPSAAPLLLVNARRGVAGGGQGDRARR